MKNIQIIIWLFCSSIVFLACTPKPLPIAYGEVHCAYCKMTVVDRQHAAQAVTKKGKNFYFDAIECLIDFTDQKSNEEWSYLLVCDYASPANMIEAKSAHYLISRAIPSPMGAYLSAFGSRDMAQSMWREKGGDLYDWTQVKNRKNLSMSLNQ